MLVRSPLTSIPNKGASASHTPMQIQEPAVKCPYQDHQTLTQLPCNHIRHPKEDKDYLILCTFCDRHLDTRIIDSEGSKWLFLIVASIILAILANALGLMSDSPNPSTDFRTPSQVYPLE